MGGDLLKDSIVNQELGGQRCQQGDADSQDKAAAGTVERPPQADGERRQSQRQLDVVGKVHFLTAGGSRTRQSVAGGSKLYLHNCATVQLCCSGTCVSTFYLLSHLIIGIKH